MNRWSWRYSSGAIRNAVLLGIVVVTTLGVWYFPPLFT